MWNWSTELPGTVNLVVCLVAGRIAELFAVRGEGLGWWGLRRRPTRGFASRRRSSAIVSGGTVNLVSLADLRGTVGSARVFFAAVVRRRLGLCR